VDEVQDEPPLLVPSPVVDPRLPDLDGANGCLELAGGEKPVADHEAATGSVANFGVLLDVFLDLGFDCFSEHPLRS